MKSNIPKVLHKVCGRALVKWALDAAALAGADESVVVVGHGAEAVQQELDGSVRFAMQSERLGTGHAVMQAKDELAASKVTLVLSGDTPLISPDSLKDAYERHTKSGNVVTVLTSELDNPFGYGRIVREGERVIRIVEQKDATEEQKNIREINSGIYFFDTKALLEALDKLTNKNAQGEYYLTDTIELIIKGGGRAGSFLISDSNEILGINDRVQLCHAAQIMQARINEWHMLNGVTMVDSNSIYITAGVEIGMDTIIYPHTTLEGSTKIGANCKISGSSLVDSTVGDETQILNSVMLASTVGSNTKIGPFAYLRPNSDIGNNVKIGDFVEIKNSKLGNNTKVSHLSYIGDADVGNSVNVGCGSVVVNYDGTRKYRCVIEDGAFIGCNTNLVSPVTVRKNAFTAAGSTITEDVPENALAIARSRQVNKLGWRKTDNK